MFTAFPSYKPTFNEFNSGIFHRTPAWTGSQRHHGGSALLRCVVDVHRTPATGGLTVQETCVLPAADGISNDILVGGFNPLKDICRLGCLVPIYGNMFQTTNQYQMVHIPGPINDFVSGDIMEYSILDIMVIASCYFTMRLSLHIVPSSHNCGADGELVA